MVHPHAHFLSRGVRPLGRTRATAPSEIKIIMVGHKTYIQGSPLQLVVQRGRELWLNIPHLRLLPPQPTLLYILQLRSEKLPPSGHHVVDDYTSQHSYTKDRQQDDKKAE